MSKELFYNTVSPLLKSILDLLMKEDIFKAFRFAEIDDIVAMKTDVVGRGGRKKDFWDLHELLSDYSIDQMLQLHQERYPYTHDGKEILSNFRRFEDADADFDPECLRGKYWELVKLDILEASKGI